MFPASSGTIFVYGKDIRTDQDTIRKDMGICMQHNVLFSYLTTEEHLHLYGDIKVPHWSRQELQQEVDRYSGGAGRGRGREPPSHRPRGVVVLLLCFFRVGVLMF